MRVLLSRKLVVFGLIIIFLLLVAVIFAPVLTPYDQYQQSLRETLQQPSWSHLLGTDNLGRDLLTRLLYGARISLLIGLVVVIAAAAVGTLLGAIAGYYERWLGSFIMRVMDAVMSIPMILLALIIAALLGGGMLNVMIALAVALTPAYARLMHGQVMTVKQNDYILAEKAIGSRGIHIMLRHLLPNCLPQILVVMAMMLGGAILAEAGRTPREQRPAGVAPRHSAGGVRRRRRRGPLGLREPGRTRPHRQIEGGSPRQDHRRDSARPGRGGVA